MSKAKRIVAIIGLALIALMYTLTIIFSLMHSPVSQNLLMAAIFCTIAVPVIIYAMQLVARNLKKRAEQLKKEALAEAEHISENATYTNTESDESSPE